MQARAIAAFLVLIAMGAATAQGIAFPEKPPLATPPVCTVVISTVTNIHPDPRRSGTDVELDRKDTVDIGFIPPEYAKDFPGLNTYVGRKVVMSGFVYLEGYLAFQIPIQGTDQLRLASTRDQKPGIYSCR